MRFSKKEIFRKLIFLSLVLVWFYSCNSEQQFNSNDYYSKAALRSEREEFLTNTINKTILKNLSQQLNDSTEAAYEEAFWAMELIQFHNAFCDSAVKETFKTVNYRSVEFQRSFLELIFTLFKEDFSSQVMEFARQTENPKLFAMCMNYLKGSDNDLKSLFHNFTKKYTEQSDNPIITMLKNDLFTEKQTLPPIADLLSKSFGKNELVLYSFQRSNRDFPGLLVIKKPDGKFLRNEAGEIFSVPQLARAITDLPGYITNGNTPKGILSIQGIGFSKNTFIGPSPNLQLALPYEVNPIIFLHSEISDNLWELNQYRNLLPQSWQNYFPIYEAYYAGKAGRTEIIAHGTTIDPSFYTGASYFPYAPSLGCLTTKELWSDATGKITVSDQIKLMNAYKKAGSNEGFLIVVDINDEQSPVTLSELKPFIIEAEK